MLMNTVIVPSTQGFDLEQLLTTLEQDDRAAYRTVSRTIETLEQLSVAFLELEDQLLHVTGIPEGLHWLYRSYFSTLDDSLSRLFTQICQVIVPHLWLTDTTTADSPIQQEFDFSS